MKISQIFLAAAEDIEQGREMFCCTAIQKHSEYIAGGPAIDFFTKHFKPWFKSSGNVWWPAHDGEIRVRTLRAAAEKAIGMGLCVLLLAGCGQTHSKDCRGIIICYDRGEDEDECQCTRPATTPDVRNPRYDLDE